MPEQTPAVVVETAGGVTSTRRPAAGESGYEYVAVTGRPSPAGARRDAMFRLSGPDGSWEVDAWTPNGWKHFLHVVETTPDAAARTAWAAMHGHAGNIGADAVTPPEPEPQRRSPLVMRPVEYDR